MILVPCIIGRMQRAQARQSKGARDVSAFDCRIFNVSCTMTLARLIHLYMLPVTISLFIKIPVPVQVNLKAYTSNAPKRVVEAAYHAKYLLRYSIQSVICHS